MMIDLTKPFSFLFTSYIAAVIVFHQNYMTVTYAINALLIVVFFFYTISGRKNIKFNPLIAVYTLFVVLSLASSLWAVSFDAASFRSLQLFLIVINLIILYNLMINFDLKNSFTYGILIGSFVNYAFIMGIIPAPFEIMKSWRYIGTVGNANDLAITMLTSIFISMIYLMDKGNKKNWLLYYQYVNILFAMYVIFLTVSKKGIIFGLILLLFYIVISLKNKAGIARIVILGTLALLIFYFFADTEQINNYFERTINRFTHFSTSLDQGVSRFSSTGIRKRLIELGLIFFQEKPLFGYGLGNYMFLSEEGLYSHNNFIELLVGVGLIGFGLFYYIYYYLFTLVYNMKKSGQQALIIFFIMILLVMDMALVSYGSKLRIFLLLFISVHISQKIKEELITYER